MAKQFDISFLIQAIDKFSVPMQNMSRNLEMFQKQMERQHAKLAGLRNFGEGMKSFGRNMSMYVTLPILGIGAAAIKAASDFESLQASFEVLLGSADKGQKLFKDIVKMAAATPFETTDLAENAKMMLNFGVSLDKVLPNLQMLGDIAGNDKNKLNSLTLAFSQTHSTGRLMGQDLLQMVNAGFNPLQIISEKTGKSMAQLKKEMEKGAISSEMVAEAFKSATSEGGRFFNNMQKQSRTIAGLMSTLRDNVTMALAEIGFVLVKTFNLSTNIPKLSEGILKLTDRFKKFAEANPFLTKMIVIIVALTAALGPLIVAVGMLTTALTTLLANPVVLIIVGVVIAIAMLTAYTIWLWKNFDHLGESLRKMHPALRAVMILAMVMWWPIMFLVAGMKKLVAVIDFVQTNFERLKNAVVIGANVMLAAISPLFTIFQTLFSIGNKVFGGGEVQVQNTDVSKNISSITAKTKSESLVNVRILTDEGTKALIEKANTKGLGTKLKVATEGAAGRMTPAMAGF